MVLKKINCMILCKCFFTGGNHIIWISAWENIKKWVWEMQSGSENSPTQIPLLPSEALMLYFGMVNWDRKN